MARFILALTMGLVSAGSVSAQFLEKKTISLAGAKKMASACETEAAKTTGRS